MSTDSTPIGTPEGSIYTPSNSSSGGDSLTSSFIDHPLASHDLNISSVLGEDGDDDNTSVAGSSSSGISYDDAEAEWRESLQQLELLVSLVVIPFFGKWVGRKCAYWAWVKFMAWKHPAIEIKVTNRALFNAVGVVGAISTPGAPL